MLLNSALNPCLALSPGMAGFAGHVMLCMLKFNPRSRHAANTLQSDLLFAVDAKQLGSVPSGASIRPFGGVPRLGGPLRSIISATVRSFTRSAVGTVDAGLP